MKMTQKHFTPELRSKIEHLETELNKLLIELFNKHESNFLNKGLKLEVSLEKEGEDYFEPGYHSSAALGVSEETVDLIDLHVIPIWKCELSLLGIPVSKKVVGSKITGELLDESIQEVKQEINEYLKEMLEMDYNK
ncbi:hypothetical protein [Bacillus suaedaesalsae]|uniref:Uncharacterized protein n=1 Tax=Bacillus suaedaesalsae TaxID=2810349 RepID=A0ABS2DKY8_9BACI|nr:hypothetical protein [Bacillus suaedaesalsae]MBM6619157.1 hypothetical protein [Bacillus suaedaesalsae]